MRIGAVEREVCVCIVSRPTAVQGSEAHFDVLTVIRIALRIASHEADTYGGPVFPCHLTIARGMPVLGIVDGRRIGERSLSAEFVNDRAVGFHDFQFERRFIFLRVSLRVLEYDGIMHNENTMGGRIDQNIIGHRLRFSTPFPVTEPDGCESTLRHGVQEAVGTRIDLCGVHMQRMTALLSVRAVIDDTYIIIRRRSLLRIRVVTVGTNHILSVEVHEVDTVVIRAIDENLGVIDIIGPKLIIFTAYAHVVRTLQDTFERIGTVSSVLAAEALHSVGDTANGIGPIEVTGLAVLDIKLRQTALPGDEHR